MKRRKKMKKEKEKMKENVNHRQWHESLNDERRTRLRKMDA